MNKVLSRRCSWNRRRRNSIFSKRLVTMRVRRLRMTFASDVCRWAGSGSDQFSHQASGLYVFRPIGIDPPKRTDIRQFYCYKVRRSSMVGNDSMDSLFHLCLAQRLRRNCSSLFEVRQSIDSSIGQFTLHRVRLGCWTARSEVNRRR